MITGYFMCKSHITMRKFLKLLLWVMFYKIVISAIFLFSEYQPYSIGHMMKELLPITNVETGFVSCYLLFFLLIPFLNVLIRSLTQRQHFNFILALLFVYCVLGTIPKIHVTMNYVSWFSILYFIASYIRLYPIPKKKNVRFWGWSTIVLILLSVLSIISFAIIAQHSGKGSGKIYYFVADSNKIFPVFIGITSFLFFKEVKIPQSKFINTVAASTFGVLLIHANSDTMRHWLWKTVCNNAGMYSSDLIYIHAILVPVAVFIICIIIDYIRIRTIENPAIRFFLPYAERFKNWALSLENRIITK